MIPTLTVSSACAYPTTANSIAAKTATPASQGRFIVPSPSLSNMAYPAAKEKRRELLQFAAPSQLLA